ncbi:MAG: hypothetical protein HKP61_23445 [Dactylosporangium sp.]|nr:hypothetical protein [Dactylosporangium sp.]NNJ63835.1 hypothetical protein [Dactylosporangium sp.]
MTQTKNAYLAARHRRVAARRGKKRAIVAVSTNDYRTPVEARLGYRHGHALAA